MRTRNSNRLTAIAAGAGLCALAWSLAACAPQTVDETPPAAIDYTAPQAEPHGDPARSFAQAIKISHLRVAASQVCPFVEFNGREALFVLPTGAEAAAEPPTVTYSGVTFGEGDRLKIGALSVIDGGFECGEQHWDLAVRLRGEEPSIALQDG